ncbi:MAG: hypothetical protein DWQ11_08365 [Proteobacteria bacterium]|nr:MAG: hypothetical protein DWQ11_08365 [Pseudomonadota bacterium]
MTERAAVRPGRRVPWMLISVAVFVLGFMARTGYDIYDKRQAMAKVLAAYAAFDAADGPWQRAADAAGKAAPDARAPLLEELQRGEATVAGVPATGCAARVGAQLLAAMQARRAALMVGEADAGLAEAMGRARDAWLEYELARAKCFEAPRS